MQDVTGLPRYFWRRAFAYVIDIVVIAIVFNALLYAVALVSPWNTGYSFFSSRVCEQVTTGLLVDKVEAQWPLNPGERRVNVICSVDRFNGHPPEKYFTTSVSTTSGKPIFTRSATTEIDDGGNAINTGIAVPFTSFLPFLVIPLTFAILSANGRRTVGKVTMSLRLMTLKNIPPTLQNATCREVFKLLPMFVFAVVFAGFFLLKSPDLTNFDHNLAAARDITATQITSLFWICGGIGIAGLVWWLFPLIFWRGQTFYDRLSACKVIKS
jgi:uncharacterized RDD family membrane protein YckC